MAPSKGVAVSELETVDKILDAAQSLFLRDGYGGVNLDQIARSAGVARQTLYNRFGSKESVFRSMTERHWSTLQNGIVDDAAVVDSPQSPETVLTDFARAILDFVDHTDQVAFIRLVIAESRHLPWIAEEFYRAGKKPLLDALVARLDRLSADEMIECGSTQVAAHQFFGLLQELTLWPRVMGVADVADDIERDEVIAESVATFMARYGRSER